ncbi:MAG: hypothetical protein GY780_18905 [bacterium]|nr:hypothetical protein [bacterium]
MITQSDLEQGDLPVHQLDYLECICSTFTGEWTINLDTDCNGTTDLNRDFILNADMTWTATGFPNGGSWSQEDCTITLLDNFFDPPLVWEGVFHEGEFVGTYAGEFNGCWTGDTSGVVDEDCETVSNEEESWDYIKGMYR